LRFRVKRVAVRVLRVGVQGSGYKSHLKGLGSETECLELGFMFKGVGLRLRA